MPVIDLSRRITNDWKQYNENKKSYESYIYIKSEKDLVIQSNTSVNLTIGDTWYSGEKHTNIMIDEKGIKIKPKKYVVLTTEQHFAIPRNVFGIVVGKGINIFNGGVVSTGKIVPGYNDKLRIGYYNASDSTIVLHKGDLIGCCFFFNIELTVINEYLIDEHENAPVLEHISKKRKMWESFVENWYSVVSVFISIIAIIISICK